MGQNKKLIVWLIIAEILLGIAVAYFFVIPQLRSSDEMWKATVYSYVPTVQIAEVPAVSTNAEPVMHVETEVFADLDMFADTEVYMETEAVVTEATEAPAEEASITVSVMDASVRPGDDRLWVVDAQESSHYVQENYNNYAAQTCDGDVDTSWQEAENGPGIGSWIQYTFDGEQSFREIIFWLGVWREAKDKDYYHDNYRPKKILIETDTDAWTASFEDVKCPQRVKSGPALDYDWSDVAYNITVNYTESTFWEKEFNGSEGSAKLIGLGETHYGCMMDDGDADYYKFATDKDGFVSFSFGKELDKNTKARWYLNLTNASNQHIVKKEFYAGDNLTYETSKIHLTPGEYYLKVTSGDDYHDQWSDVTYSICINFSTTNCAITGHQYGPWKITKKATVLQEGEKVRVCSVCGEKDTAAIAKIKAKMQLNVTSIKLKVKQSTTKVRVSGLVAGDAVKSWRSSDTKIATVSKNGKITAKSKTGRATITVTLKSGLEKSLVVTVQKGAVACTKVTLNKNKVTLKKGKTFVLQASIKPFTCVQKAKYKTSNKKVATVSSSGKIKAKKKGTAVITVTVGNKKVKCKVKVK